MWWGVGLLVMIFAGGILSGMRQGRYSRCEDIVAHREG